MSAQKERLISSSRGVIMGAADGLVSVKFREEEVVVDFPLTLFGDRAFVRYGQPVVYEIRERANGYRYQSFVPLTDEQPNPHLDKVKGLLNKVRLR